MCVYFLISELLERLELLKHSKLLELLKRLELLELLEQRSKSDLLSELWNQFLLISQ